MTTAKWMLYAKKADFNGIGTHFHISPVIARIIRNRDVCGDENIEKYLRGTWKDLYSPHRLKDADLAAGLLLEKIRQGNGSGSWVITILMACVPLICYIRG